MEEDLISVIVPVYNVEKYIKNCIDSIINQTYKNLEIILIDDGSKDNSGKICDEYTKLDNRIKAIHKKNGGLSDARNVGIDNATGKYITFIDSDDYVENDYVEYLYKLIKKYNVKMSISSYKVICKNETKIIDMAKNNKDEKLKTQECLRKMLCEKGFTVSACTKMYEKSLFSDIRFPLGKLCEDNGTTYKLILKCENIIYGNKSNYHYYKRNNSIMTSKFTKHRLDIIDLTDEMVDVVEKEYPELIDTLEKRKITVRFSILRQMVTSKLDDEMKEKEKEIINYIKSKRKDILKNKEIDKRDKIALISLLLHKEVFKVCWNIYCKIKY